MVQVISRGKGRGGNVDLRGNKNLNIMSGNNKGGERLHTLTDGCLHQKVCLGWAGNTGHQAQERTPKLHIWAKSASGPMEPSHQWQAGPFPAFPTPRQWFWDHSRTSFLMFHSYAESRCLNKGTSRMYPSPKFLKRFQKHSCFPITCATTHT